VTAPRTRAVVTGASSFVGYHVVRWLHGRGAEVVGTLSRPLAAYDGIPRTRLRLLGQSGVPLRELDLRQEGAAARVVGDLAPDVWIQVAGWTSGYASASFDLEAAVHVNALSLSGIVSALSHAGARGLILTGSVSEYSDSDLPHQEDEACWPAMPYGLSKLAGTLRGRQLAHEHGLPVRVARLFLPFGLLDAPHRLMAQALAGFRTGATVAMSPCEQRRDLLHVSDVCGAYEALLGHLGAGSLFEVFNVCAGEAPRLRDAVLELARLTGADPAQCAFGALAMRPGEPQVVAGSPAKAAAQLGWRPSSWREGLARYVREAEKAPAEAPVT
jgi:nucleoside-diphosphate-sugar epimerase